MLIGIVVKDHTHLKVINGCFVMTGMDGGSECSGWSEAAPADTLEEWWSWYM